MFFFLALSILCWRGVRITYLGLKLCTVFLKVACFGIIVLVWWLILLREPMKKMLPSLVTWLNGIVTTTWSSHGFGTLPFPPSPTYWAALMMPSQRGSTSWSMMRSTGVVGDVSKWRGSDDVTWADVSRWRFGACRRVEKTVSTWRRMSACEARELWRRIVWWHMEALMMVRFPWDSRSAEDDLSGTCKNTIGARITAARVWQWSRDSECRQLQVRNQRRWLKCVRGLTTNGCSSNYKGRNNCESGIIPMKTGLQRKIQSDGFDTMLEILKNCIVFFNQRIYIGAFI